MVTLAVVTLAVVPKCNYAVRSLGCVYVFVAEKQESDPLLSITKCFIVIVSEKENSRNCLTKEPQNSSAGSVVSWVFCSDSVCCKSLRFPSLAFGK